MKNYLVNILKMLFLATILISCGTPKDSTEDNEDANNQFFDVVYITQASKISGQSSWTVVQGDQRIKFLQSSEASTGTFTFSFANFREPQLATNACSGGFTGDYTTESTEDTTVDNEENTSYNPLDPYDPETENPDNGDEDEEEIDQILVYVFDLALTDRSLTSGCRNYENAYQVKAIRFTNGDVILTDLSRNIDYYMVPEIIGGTE